MTSHDQKFNRLLECIPASEHKLLLRFARAFGHEGVAEFIREFTRVGPPFDGPKLAEAALKKRLHIFGTHT